MTPAEERQWPSQSGIPVARLNLRIAAMVLAGALARVIDPGGEAAFATKGGVAMELWMSGRARATRDIDLVLRGDPDRLGERLDAALNGSYIGFTFRRGGIDSPDVVLVLDARWQIAQKLHAVTERPKPGRENPRFRDLIDLQFLETLSIDFASVRDACERVFAARAQQPWPPVLVINPSWPQGYAALATELGFAVTDVEQAASAVRDYIERIASA